MPEQEQVQNAIHKEIIGAFSDALWRDSIDKTMKGKFYTYFSTNLKVVKLCPTNSATEGCWDETIQGVKASESMNPGFTFHNGATVIGLGDTLSTNYREYFIVDYNGIGGPIQMGKNQMYLKFCQNTLS